MQTDETLLRLFAHPVACCCAKFEIGQTFELSTSNISFVPLSPKRSPTMLDPSAKLFQHCWNHSLAKMAVEFKFTKSYGSYPFHNAMIIVACARLSVCEDERKDEKRARERASGKQREG